MKVLQVNKLYYPHIGGVENVVRMYVVGLKDKVEIEVLAANEAPHRVVEMIDGVRVTKVASLGRLRSTPLAPGFVTELKNNRSDICHFHFPNPTGEMAYLAAKPKGKLVVTYHSDIIRQKVLLKLYRPFLERFLDKADKIMASSPNLIQSSPFLQRVKDKCTVVPFSVPTDWLSLTPAVAARAAELRERYGPKIAFFLGRLIYYKGVDYLIRAFRDIDARLIIAGEGELGPELKKLTEELSIAHKVDFVGALPGDELAAFYHACDVFVLPSVESSEAYGLVQLEAHACGKPVVSTNLPTGVPFVNKDGVSGLVVPPKDVDALAGALHGILGDDELRARLGRQAKARFEREFAMDVMLERLLEVYKDVV